MDGSSAQAVRKSSVFTKSSPINQERQTILVVDSILRRMVRGTFCKGHMGNRTECCLFGAKTWHVSLRLDRLLKLMGKDPFVMVHVSPNGTVLQDISQIVYDVRELGRSC